MIKNIFVAIVFVAVFTFCGMAQEKQAAPDEDLIRNVLVTQQQAWNNGDVEGYMNGYWKSDSLLFTSGGNIQRGWDSTFAKYKKTYDSKEKMGTLAFSQLEIRLLSPDAAWIFGHWELTRAKDHPEGVFTLLLRKFTDGWKIIHDHTSSKQ